MTVQSVSRAFTILKTLSLNPDGMGVTELARQMDIHKSTVSRLLSTLENEAAVERVPNGSRFRIGHGLLDLVPHVDKNQYLSSLLRPIIGRLAAQIGESVGLSVINGNSSTTVSLTQSSHSIQVRNWLGDKFPLHISSSGKIYMANWSEQRLASYLQRPLVAYTTYSITQPSKLRDRLAEIRRVGYDWTFDEFEEGLVAVSAPVKDAANNVIATIYISGPRFRFPPDGMKEMITKQLLKSCEQATQLVIENNDRLRSIGY